MKNGEACPVSAATILDFLVKKLVKRDFFHDTDNAEIFRLAGEMAPVLPDNYFPDTILDIDLTGEENPLLAFRMDSRECNLVNYLSEEKYFAESGVPAVIAPQQWEKAALMVFTEDRKIPLEIDEALISARQALYPEFEALAAEHPAARILLERLAAFPVKSEIHKQGGKCTVSFTGGIRNPKKRFSGKEYADKLLAVLEELGAPKEPLFRLKSLSCNYAIPFYDAKYGYKEWICSTDVAYFSVTFDSGCAMHFHVGIVLSDKCEVYWNEGIKPSQAYQWHITDNCDQRCRHCYLFAEDALLKCVTTPWDMLMRTLDECTLDAARRHAWPMLAVTGGDPILHPRFWDFAEEIHRRGIDWDILGNPFHLTREVCLRLRKLGVRNYQMSLDGLEPFHDYMRKSGSYKATLEAVQLLNDAGIGSQIMATASRKNLDDIIALMDVVAERNVYSFAFARYCATSPDKAQDYPTPEEYHRFMERYYDKSRELRSKGCKTRFSQKDHLFTLLKWERGEFVVPEYSKTHPDMICDGCHLGRSGCILANGDVVACRRMESVVGNVWTKSLSELETCEKMERYADVREIAGCRDCELLNWCRGCRAVGYNATGDIHAADPCCWKKSDTDRGKTNRKRND